MRVVITGATGFVGSALTEALLSRGDEVVALSRDAEAARAALPGLTAAYRWSPVNEPAPAEAFTGADAVVNLVGARTTGRWSSKQKQMILETRETATRNLVAGMAGQRAPVLVSGSALGYYGDRGDEDLTEQSSPGDDFLADVCAMGGRCALRRCVRRSCRAAAHRPRPGQERWRDGADGAACQAGPFRPASLWQAVVALGASGRCRWAHPARDSAHGGNRPTERWRSASGASARIRKNLGPCAAPPCRAARARFCLAAGAWRIRRGDTEQPAHAASRRARFRVHFCL